MRKFVASPQSFTAYVLLFLSVASIGALRSSAQNSADPAFTPTNGDIAAYRIFFRRVATYRRMSNEAAASGEDKTYLIRSLQHRLGLGESDMIKIEMVASDCQSELAPLQARMQVVLAQFRSRFPGNKFTPGTNISPPLELIQIQGSEDAVIWRFRSKLSEVVGTSTFANADRTIRSSYGNLAATMPTPTGNGMVN